MRYVYGQRRQALLDALADAFGDTWRACGDAAGLHIAVDFPNARFDGAFKKACLEKGVYVMPLCEHCIRENTHMSKLLLGYGHLEPDEIRRGVACLRGVISV